MEFCIPLSRSDLTKEDGRGSYCVRERVVVSELSGRIEGK